MPSPEFSDRPYVTEQEVIAFFKKVGETPESLMLLQAWEIQQEAVSDEDSTGFVRLDFSYKRASLLCEAGMFKFAVAATSDLILECEVRGLEDERNFNIYKKATDLMQQVIQAADQKGESLE